jgi:hypothetical protein
VRYLVAFTILLFVSTLLGPAIINECLGMSDHAAQASTKVSNGSEAKETDKDMGQSDDQTARLVRSKHDRRVERRTNWREGLEGDKARTYEIYGYPSGKIREEVMGTVTERWVYPEQGVTIKFKGNKIIR